MPRKLHGIDYIQTTEPDLLFRDVSLYTETVASPAQAGRCHSSGDRRLSFTRGPWRRPPDAGSMMPARTDLELAGLRLEAPGVSSSLWRPCRPQVAKLVGSDEAHLLHLRARRPVIQRITDGPGSA